MLASSLTKSLLLLAAGFSHLAAAACSRIITARQGDTCTTLASLAGISVAQFLRSNPSVTNCADLVAGGSYCVEGTADSNPGVTVTITIVSAIFQTTTVTQTRATATRTVTAPASSITTTVRLTSVVTSVSTSTSTLTSTRTSVVNVTITSIVTSTRLVTSGTCVSAAPTSSRSTLTTATTTSHAPGGRPLLPGTPPNCRNYDQIRHGDTCRSLANRSNLTLLDFYALNPLINCDALWVGYYVCAGR